jgi:flagellar M-ring protein FliF
LLSGTFHLAGEGQKTRRNVVRNLLSIWATLDQRRRLVVAGATVAVFLAVLGLARLSGAPPMALLYSGLEPAAAGEVVAALEQAGAVHEVRGEAIYVAAAERDSLRLTLAAQGLPAAGGAGYELLDSLSGFGTTAQMFDAAYWRAKEGELARTIQAVPQVRAARVHIAPPSDQPFARATAATASVTVTTAAGTLAPDQAQALRHLVAAAVSGMRPEDVQVIDSVGGLIGGPEADDPSDRAAAIRANVERLLTARVGPGKAVVEVALDLVTDRESITERRFDPQGRVAIATETEERSGSSSDAGGEVTVASNLPEGDAAGGGGQSQEAETRERVNYEVSETQREVERAPGAVRRMSVAVLVDGEQVTAEDGTVSWQPRSEEELAVLRELVASAAGVDEARGDVLTVRSLQFQPLGGEGSAAVSSLWPAIGPIDPMRALQLAVLAVVALVLGLFVLRPVLMNGRRGADLSPPGPLLALPGVAGATSPGAPRVLTGEIDEGGPDSPALARLEDAGAGTPAAAAEDPVARLRRLIEERQEESVEILRGWIELEEERR